MQQEEPDPRRKSGVRDQPQTVQPARPEDAGQVREAAAQKPEMAPPPVRQAPLQGAQQVAEAGSGSALAKPVENGAEASARLDASGAVKSEREEMEGTAGTAQPPQPEQTAGPVSVPQPVGLAVPAAIERVEGFLRRLAVEHDKEGFFQQKVSTDLRGCEDYYDRIKTPMWFARVREKLRAGDYRTLHQLQLDVELICSNATTFNQKASRVYKNAQNMLKGCRKQLTIEREMLTEAIRVLHPGGPEGARADEAEEERAARAALPPKKPPAKPSKPHKPPKKVSQGSVTGSLLRMTSSPQMLTPLSSMSPGSDFAHLLGAPEDNHDLLVDAHAAEDVAYSSFSETEDEAGPMVNSLSRMGASAERQSWDRGAPDRAGATAPSLGSASTSNAWKAKRRGVEWRIRWLEHRLAEISHQQGRYAARLERLLIDSSEAAEPILRSGVAMPPPASIQGASGEAALAAATPAVAAAAIQSSGPGMPELPSEGKQRASHRRRKARERGMESPLDHPFFAAQAGIHRTKQVVRDADGGLSFDEDEAFPARAYAGLELLEQHIVGLRRQLCQPGTGMGLPRKGFFAGPTARGAVKGPGLKVSQAYGSSGSLREAKPSKRRRTGEGGSGEFLLPGAGGSQSFVRIRASKITTPHFHEHSAEELRSRAAALLRLDEREAAKQAAAAAGRPVPEPSSSEEDTDDDAFTRIHSVMQDQERAMYAGTGWTGGAQKKKKNKKSKDGKGTLGSDTVKQEAAAGSLPGSATGVAGSEGATLVHPNGPVRGEGLGTLQEQPTAFSPDAAPMEEDVLYDAEEPDRGSHGRRGRPPGSFLRGRGRPRARGRPPNSGRGLLSAVRPNRPAGPGRGHKTHRIAPVADGSHLQPFPVASAIPAALTAAQPALSGGAADSELTDPHGGVDVPVGLAQENSAGDEAAEQPVMNAAAPEAGHAP